MSLVAWLESERLGVVLVAVAGSVLGGAWLLSVIVVAIDEAPWQVVNGARDSARRSPAAARRLREAEADGWITLEEVRAVEAARIAEAAARR